MGRKKIIDKRICIKCHSDATFTARNGNEQWYNRNGWYCKKCYNKYCLNPKWHPITNPKHIQFKGHRTYLGHNPRKGRCIACMKSIGDTYLNSSGKIDFIKYTSMHHTIYHDEDLLKDTIELCPSCHVKESWRLGQVRGGGRPKKYLEEIKKVGNGVNVGGKTGQASLEKPTFCFQYMTEGCRCPMNFISFCWSAHLSSNVQRYQ